MTVDLTSTDRAILAGRAGEAAQIAMRVIVELAEISGAHRLIDITSAHIDGCLYHGRAGLDWAERLVAAGGRVAVPATLNVSSLDLLHPELFRGNPSTAAAARKLMDCYTSMGCRPTWTCAPYQLPERPGFGEQIAWAESNAIVFANSVLGARTERYGDFVDICAALSGRVPKVGLHTDAGRRAKVLFRLESLPPELLSSDFFFPVLGHLVGGCSGKRVPVIAGLDHPVSEDRLKALGAAAASAGAVGMFHVVGTTPEAPTLEAALTDTGPEEIVDVTRVEVARARDSLSTTATGKLTAVSLGTPHYSVTEFAALVPLLDGVTIHSDVEFYVSTGRNVLAEIEARGWAERCRRAGVQIVTDTCTYITPILRNHPAVVMTTSAKWAYYAPGNLGVEVVLGSLDECVRSAVAGEVWRDERLWQSS